MRFSPGEMKMEKILFVAVGGAVGSSLRYLLAGWGQRLIASPFPLGTMLVNILGCLAIGFLATALSGPLLVREHWRIAILVGVLGGFTTFSSFCWETVSLGGDGQFALAGLNVLAQNALGLTAAWVGARLAQAIFGL